MTSVETRFLDTVKAIRAMDGKAWAVLQRCGVCFRSCGDGNL